MICHGENDGRLEIFATGGTGTILYAISPQLNQFFETHIFENIAPGVYDVIVQDELGCFISFNFEIIESPPVLITIIPDSIIPEICQGDVDGFFSIEIQGGTLPYSVSLDDYNGDYITGEPDQTEFEFTELVGGSHTVFVRDSLGCESEWSIDFPESIFIEPMVEVAYLCLDNETINSVTVTVDESIIDISQLEYSLNNGPYQSSNVFEKLPPGTDNFIIARHTNGCEQITDFFDIETFTPLSLTLNNSGLNEITASTIGGTGDYQFTLNDIDFGSTNVFTITDSGTFVVTVTDSTGCMVTASIILEFIEICIPNYFSPNGDGVTDYWAPGCVGNYPNLVFSIFDRYGRKVAMLPVGEKWDGRYNSTELPTGDYWYVVRLGTENDHEYVGHFTLYR
jgi:gliding motility-associated-like protein